MWVYGKGIIIVKNRIEIIRFFYNNSSYLLFYNINVFRRKKIAQIDFFFKKTTSATSPNFVLACF